MKDTFDFPRFEDLQLGPWGKTHGCGCLWAKELEIDINSDMATPEQKRFHRHVTRSLGGIVKERLLSSRDCPNTLANRRKAYRALEHAVEQMGYEIGR